MDAVSTSMPPPSGETNFSAFITTFGLLSLLYALFRRFNRISVSYLPGPPAQSFMLGNLPELFQSQAGEPDFKYQREYGGIVRIKGVFGEDRLLISDPKALQYIFHTSGYRFQKWPERTEISRVLMGRGLLWADGETHRRQRKVMLPGFGTTELKAFVPIFQKSAVELTMQWNDIVVSSPNQSAVFNVASWLSRATMDSIGEAAFDYQFGALSNTKNEFMEAYLGLMSDTLGCPPDSAIFMQTALPIWILQFMSKYSGRRNLVHARRTAEIANGVTRGLVKSKAEALLQGKGNKDILSLLVKANASENVGTKLTEEEMLAQMRTILLAGHETSATSMCWVLLELARHPDVQDRLRQEIRTTEMVIKARGDTDFAATDMENMPYLNAVLKESMRYHPALYQNYRQAVHDDILPLSKPIETSTGMINNIPIARGTKVILSIAAYHRNKEIFGEDADVYNPDRWLKPSDGSKKGPSVGMFSNLLTFSGGVRSCIGWKFALYEMQALTIEIVNNFQLSPTPDIERLRREACLVMLPTLEDEQLKGENLPLRISLAARDIWRRQPTGLQVVCSNIQLNIQLSSSLIVGNIGYVTVRLYPKRWLLTRYFSTETRASDSGESENIDHSDSIFSTKESAWDHVFANLDDYASRSLPSRREQRPHAKSVRRFSRRQTMTAREISAFDEIFNMIFDAASKHEDMKSRLASGSEARASDTAAFDNDASDLFTTLRRNSRVLKWTEEQDESLDRKKEEIDLCVNDAELLQWAQREVLGVFSDTSRTSQQSGVEAIPEQPEGDSKNNFTSSPPSSSPSATHIQTYPHLVAYLMRTFRDKYRDPYLALALFNQVRHRSLISYVFGCSTQVYNELIETKWSWFRDLKGVHDALEEMIVNGVQVDSRTRKLIDIVRREVGERNAWAEDLEVRGGEVWNILLRIEHFLSKSTSTKKGTLKWDEWKKQPLGDQDGDRWGFNKWLSSAEN
ncbi:hypothetical protein AX17_005765 [Amanita inopinata Kibby_2008]|nr:hypothetical protein AX17_005765 [Amanita inopinata Kibby_2008]